MNAFKANKRHFNRMHELFKEHEMKLSYFDFFTYIEKDLKITLEEWEKNSLEQFLDSQGMAFIEFNEFNEFLRDFGYNTGIKVEEDDEDYGYHPEGHQASHLALQAALLLVVRPLVRCLLKVLRLQLQ